MIYLIIALTIIMFGVSCMACIIKHEEKKSDEENIIVNEDVYPQPKDGMSFNRWRVE